MAISNDKVSTDLSNHIENIQPVAPKADVYIPAEFSEVDNGEIAIEALGGTVHDLPPGYYRSFNFIGTILALCLGQICCYFGFVLPANVLGIINDDIGPNPNYVWTAMIVSLDTNSIWPSGLWLTIIAVELDASGRLRLGGTPI